MATSVNISVVIITHNEEKNIARCIASVQTIADEIVVVDSFSTDRTEEICKEKGVKFIQHAFEGHIQQKNYAITQATYPHILSLDADEELSETLTQSIQYIKQHWEADGYYFNRLTNYCGSWIKHGGWYPDKKLRLWDSRKGCWTGVNPHDQYTLIAGSTQQYLKGDLLHYSYNSISQHLQQVDYFTTIACEQAFAQGIKANPFMLVYKLLYRFVKGYIFQLGFLDGFAGWCIAVISAYASFIKYAKLYLKQRNATS